MPTSPPYRADHVGSLLRPPEVKRARTRHALGELSTEDLRAIEDSAIRHAVAQQEKAGLHAVTDGEFRRASWQWDFLAGLDGISLATGTVAAFRGNVPTQRVAKVTGRIAFPSHHPMLADFAFLKSHTTRTAKFTIPSPTMLTSVMRDWREVVDRTIYPDLASLYADLAQAYRDALRAFAAAGCTYLQLDDCNISFLCDPQRRAALQSRGDDPEATLRAWVALMQSALSERPQGMTIATHTCRGNFRSTWAAQGGYEPVAEAVFNGFPVDAFFLEYDTGRAGGFEPLRFMPNDKTVALGLVSTKLADLESSDSIRRRIDEATKYVPLDRLCLSPQCGFASTEEGNELAEDTQWRKLAFVVETAATVWNA